MGAGIRDPGTGLACAGPPPAPDNSNHLQCADAPAAPAAAAAAAGTAGATAAAAAGDRRAARGAALVYSSDGLLTGAALG